MERHTEIVRQWRILLTLEGRARGLTLAEAQDVVGEGVSERTIRRDLDALTQAGFPIETIKRDGKTGVHPQPRRVQGRGGRGLLAVGTVRALPQSHRADRP